MPTGSGRISGATERMRVQGSFELRQLGDSRCKVGQNTPAFRKRSYPLDDRPGFGVELIPVVEKKFPWAPGYFQRPNPVMEGSTD